jgi:oligoendopeptidase F
MGMELLTAPHWGAFYDDADLRRARTEHLEGIVQFLPYMAIVDEFQDEVYTRPQATPAQRRAVWVKLLERYGGIEDWSGHERARECSWHRQPHPFEVPFYYIEYGIAQLGALQLWVKARRNAASALGQYKRGLALGGSRPLPELFRAAGLNFDFSSRTLGPLVEQVLREVDAGDGAGERQARAPKAKTGSRKPRRRTAAKPAKRAGSRGRSRRGRKYR